MSGGIPSLRDQKAEARRLGIVVILVPRTGEVRFIDPCDGSSIRVNNRRKDGTREVGRLLDHHRI